MNVGYPHAIPAWNPRLQPLGRAMRAAPPEAEQRRRVARAHDEFITGVERRRGQSPDRSTMPITLVECKSKVVGANVLVTGGAGFIGSHLVDYLLQLGAGQVLVVDNLDRARSEWLRARVKNRSLRFIEADILESRGLDAALSETQLVYHLAAISRVMDACRNPDRTFEVNVLGTIRMAEAARRAGVRRLVFTSSREVYGDPASLPVAENAPLKPKNVYGASKVAAEMFLNTLDPKEIEVVTLRLANVYGPGDRGRVIPTFLANALQGRSLNLYGGKQLLDFIWVGEVMKLLVKAGFSDRPVLEPTNVGSGVATQLQDLALQISELVNSRSRLHIVPPRGPEVERYQADLTRATFHFGLRPQADPMNRLPALLDEFRSESVSTPHLGTSR